MPKAMQHIEPNTLTPNELAERYVPLAKRLAHRYANRGEPLDDLTQVAMVGLVNAARRYDPRRGGDFPRYAVPTILGELRRHFRDSCWSVRVPRALQERALQVQSTSDHLAGQLGHSPTVSEMAEELEITDGEVLEALEASTAYTAASLDAPVPHDDPAGPNLGEQLSDDETPTETVEAREAARRALSSLPERERRILTLRFFGERTQREIAEELHLSQMHVSRLLATTITRLRDHLVDEVQLPDDWSSRRHAQGHDR